MSAHHLPLLERREDELSKCAYCPKLCRASCVVSEAEPREALTPWGKMTSSYDVARSGQVDAERAGLAWACSNCFRCREACDHRNPVADTLNEARSEYVARGQEPAPVKRLLERASAIRGEQRAAVAALAPGEPASPNALLLGCRYATSHPDEARAALRLSLALLGSVQLLQGCCGHWQRAAGDAKAADRTRAELVGELAGRRLFVLDPRCALELRDASATTLVELAAQHRDRFVAGKSAVAQYRYHDSCALGRGLGLYEPPRQLLAQVTGALPQELSTSRQLARCSAGGGIVPVSMPNVAKWGRERLAEEHAALGGGTLVTGCASSLSQLRKAGVDAVDLVTVLEGGLVRDD